MRQYSWMEDSNLILEDIVEMIHLWSQHHDLAIIQHELKISKKTLIEWFTYIRHVCTAKGRVYCINIVCKILRFLSYIYM